jgi:hypothetical protein
MDFLTVFSVEISVAQWFLCHASPQLQGDELVRGSAISEVER